jgi:hypothetical protein
MTGKSRLANLQCVYQLAHAQFPAPESCNNADAGRIYDSLPKGGKVSHWLTYIGIYRYIKPTILIATEFMLFRGQDTSGGQNLIEANAGMKPTLEH